MLLSRRIALGRFRVDPKPCLAFLVDDFLRVAETGAALRFEAEGLVGRFRAWRPAPSAGPDIIFPNRIADTDDHGNRYIR